MTRIAAPACINSLEATAMMLRVSGPSTSTVAFNDMPYAAPSLAHGISDAHAVACGDVLN